MKLKIPVKQMTDNYAAWLRSMGYVFITDRRFDKSSFVRCLARANYPRFHIYVQEAEDEIVVDLHLDHKQTSYTGQHMHNAEYDGDLVEAEITHLARSVGISTTSQKVLPEAYQAKQVPTEAVKQQEVEAGRFVGRGLALGHVNLDDYQPPAKTVKKPWWKIF